MVKIGKWEVSEEDLAAEIAAAEKAAKTADETEPRAVAARYDRPSRKVIVDLGNGTTFIFPIDLVQGLKDASDEELAEIVIRPSGEGLHWPRLDWDCGVPNLMLGIFGSEAWMKQVRKEMAHTAGSVKSAAKAKSSAENGKKGGRPKKNAASGG